MSNKSALVHDLERTGYQWRAMLKASSNLPVLERAYQAVVILLLTSGLKGLAGVKTAEIAELADVNESTLFRYIDKRDQLVADSVDWCWKRVNESIAAAHHQKPLVGASARDIIMVDLEAILAMYTDSASRLCGTGAFLSYRRAEQLTAGFEAPNQMVFRNRLLGLTSSLIAECGTSDSDPEVVATYLTNYLATIWFTWMADPSAKGPEGLLGTDMILPSLRDILDRFSACQFSSYNREQCQQLKIETVD